MANAGDVNEREWILRAGVGCRYPRDGIVSLNFGVLTELNCDSGFFCPGLGPIGFGSSSLVEIVM